MPEITVVGSINMDLVVRVAHLPLPGETVLGQDYQAIPGGKGANQAVAAARLGANVAMIGCVGDDVFGRLLQDNLRREKVDLVGVQAVPETSSGLAMITVDDLGRNTIVVASGANLAMTPQQVADSMESIADIDVLVLQLESPMDCVLEAARIARARGAKVVLNPAPARPLPVEIYPYIDVLIPNESETSLLTGLPVYGIGQAEAAAQALVRAGARSVVLTLGERGALVVDEGCPAIRLPAFPAQVVDTTAAGDAFVAGLAVGLAEGKSLVDAARMGNAAGAVAVTRLGAQPAMPGREDIERLLEGRSP
jgi:ribokinase